jgi:hypothetical protein
MEWNNVFLIFRSFHVLTSYENKLVFHTLKTFENIYILKIYCMLHITSYHYYFLAKNYIFQHDMSLTYEYVLFNWASCGYGHLRGTFSVKFWIYMHQMTIFGVLNNCPTYFFITLLLSILLIYTY